MPAVFVQAVPPAGLSQVALQSLRLIVTPATVTYAVDVPPKNDCGVVAAKSRNADARARLKLSADEVFVTGTAAEIGAVAELDGRRIRGGAPGPITQRLQASYAAVVRGVDTRHLVWSTVV